MQRREEILAKKAKLAELKRQREEREQRQKELLKRESGTETPDVIKNAYSSELAKEARLILLQARGPTSTRSNDPKELEKILEELLPEKATSSGPTKPSPFSSSPRPSRPSSIVGDGRSGLESVERGLDGPQRSSSALTTSVSTQTISLGPIATNYEFVPVPVQSAPSYSRAIQTSEPWSPLRKNVSGDTFPDSDSDQFTPSRTPKASKRLSRRAREKEEELRQNIRREIEEELKAAQESVKEKPLSVQPPKVSTRTLTDGELDAVISSEEFLDFVDRSSKIVERALDEDYDVLVDYALRGQEGLDQNEDEGIREVTQFYDERWSKKRMISDLGFSPKFPELLLASYTKNPSAPQDPSGLLQIWNMHLQSRPEYTFHSNSDILTAKFSPFHPSLIVGGSYSGQVLLWDTRSRSPLPIQKTPLTGASSGGHTHPIYSISLVGTQNANNIISCSTDGVVCGWTVDMLSQPQEYLELTAPPPSKTEDISPICMSFPWADPTSFLVGTEDGTICPCHRYDRAGAKAGVDTRVRYKGHTAPVMGLDFHPVRGPIDLGDLLLSSALDWTVKLWKIRPSSTTVATTSISATTPFSNGGIEQAIEPLFEFSREEVVYDARWSPHKPGVFALVDGAGSVEVWDLTVDTEVPVSSASPEINRVAAQTSYIGKSLNKVVWEEKEGKRLAVGGAAGVVSVFEVGNDLAAEGVRGEEWTGMKRLIGRAEAGRRT